MQNKGAIVLFSVLLGLVSLFVLSKSFVSSSYEQHTKEFVEKSYGDSLVEVGMAVGSNDYNKSVDRLTRQHLRDSANTEVYPLVGLSYDEVKSSELNFGLDLQGGMSVTLEVSVKELVHALAGKTQDELFLNTLRSAEAAQKNSQDDFITLFANAWDEQKGAAGGDTPLWKYFNTVENQDRFPMNVGDEEIIALLREEATTAVDNTENIIRKRIDRFGVAQPVVQQQSFSGRIVVELPGIDDQERVGTVLKSTANLEFWDVYTADKVFQSIAEASEAVGRAKYPEAFEEAEEDDVEDTDASSTEDALDDAVDAIDDATADVTDAVQDAADDIEDLLDGDSEELDQDIEDLLDDEGDDADELSDEEIDRLRKQNPIMALANMDPRIINPRSALVGFAEGKDTAAFNELVVHPAAKDKLPSDLRLLWSANGRFITINEEGTQKEVFDLYAIKSTEDGAPRIDGSMITDARQDFDEFNKASVEMRMNSEAASIWSDWTRDAANDGKRAIAIVMDNLVYSAPSVQQQIDGGVSSITIGSGSPTQQINSAKDLAGLLKAGSLPAPARIVDQYTVGPTLGAKNIERGVTSFILALVVILVYMIFYYKGAGVISNIALIINLLFLVAALASFGAALTLPGIAGIVLTIGMAVDANVLIYERIREEIRHGKGMAVALKDGYNKAYSAIIDANITTLLTAIILFAFGSGPIRGFATTLMIGIFTSLFSAIVITRVIFFNRLEKKKPISFWTNLTKDWFTKINFAFVAKRRRFYMISGAVILAGVVSLFARGLDFGVDFRGGNQFQVAFTEEIDVDALRESLSEAFTEEGTKGSPTVQNIGGTKSYIIKTDYMIESTAENREEQIRAALDSGVSGISPNYVVEANTQVDRTISDDFQRDATLATVFSLLIIFLYIVFRFRKWQFGAGAILAMIHDVLIVLSLFSLLKGVVGFSLEINQAFIAAILTVIGYSINDTVVVFDRIREYLREFKKEDDQVVINKALNSTLSRTINTSLSTFVVLLTIFIFGGDDIKGFSFALMVGVVVGTYSSLFIATPSVVDLSKDVRA